MWKEVIFLGFGLDFNIWLVDFTTLEKLLKAAQIKSHNSEQLSSNHYLVVPILQVLMHVPAS